MFQVRVGKPIPVQFTVFEDDEYTPKGGLVAADFTVTLWKNNVRQEADIVNTLIETEIHDLDDGGTGAFSSAGTYGFVIRFDDCAFWRIVVKYPTDKRI